VIYIRGRTKKLASLFLRSEAKATWYSSR